MGPPPVAGAVTAGHPDCRKSAMRPRPGRPKEMPVGSAPPTHAGHSSSTRHGSGSAHRATYTRRGYLTTRAERPAAAEAQPNRAGCVTRIHRHDVAERLPADAEEKGHLNRLCG